MNNLQNVTHLDELIQILQAMREKNGVNGPVFVSTSDLNHPSPLGAVGEFFTGAPVILGQTFVYPTYTWLQKQEEET